MFRIHYKILVLITLSLNGIFVVTTNAATISNNISVSAESGSGGQSTIQSTTIINGKTVNDVNLTKAGKLEYHYESSTTTQSSTLFATTSPNDNVDTRIALQELVITLRQYVSYLTNLLAAATVQYK